jgi:hypothetical protein
VSLLLGSRCLDPPHLLDGITNTDRRHSALGMQPLVRFEQTMTVVPAGDHGAVLGQVKTKPSGRPSASLDPGSGRHKSAVIRRRPL